MTVETPEVEQVPAGLLIDHILAEALEMAEWNTHVNAPERGDHEVEWSVGDVDDWEVHVGTDDLIHLRGTTEASYSVQTSRAKLNPPGKAHPAEYRTETFPVHVQVTADWTGNGGLGSYTIDAEGA